MTGSDRRHGYLTQSQHQMDPRSLVLRGGPLDGLTCARVAAVGQRLFCGDGDWTVDEVYLVTTETSWTDGYERSVCVPAFGETS